MKKVLRYTVNIIFVIIILMIFIQLLKEIPHREAVNFGITDPKDLAEIENSYRVTLVQIIGSIAIGAGLYYTWRRVIIAEDELKISQQSQITERFTRAVDQLGAIDIKGNPAIEIRLGGIYALERISKESDEDYWPIIEILTAYVRKNSHGREELLPLDIEAIATVIGRRKNKFGKKEPLELNLKEVCFKGANLIGANFSKAYLPGANLSQAHLLRADLPEANLVGANLSGTDLSYAISQGLFSQILTSHRLIFRMLILDGIIL